MKIVPKALLTLGMHMPWSSAVFITVLGQGCGVWCKWHICNLPSTFSLSTGCFLTVLSPASPRTRQEPLKLCSPICQTHS